MNLLVDNAGGVILRWTIFSPSNHFGELKNDSTSRPDKKIRFQSKMDNNNNNNNNALNS